MHVPVLLMVHIQSFCYDTIQDYASMYLYRVQRPVRIMLDRNEDMLSSGGRHPLLGRYKVGFTSEGRITALDIKFYSNGGATTDLSLAVSVYIHCILSMKV